MTYAGGCELLGLLCEFWGLDENGLVGPVRGSIRAAADNDFHNGTLHQTGTWLVNASMEGRARRGGGRDATRK